MLESADEFMHVGEDGRIVHFVYTDPSGKRLVPMMLWFEHLGGDRYCIRARPGQDGWSVLMVPTDSGMTIDRTERQVECVAVSESEVPAWYRERLEYAFSLMNEREQQQERQNKAEEPTPNPPSD